MARRYLQNSGCFDVEEPISGASRAGIFSMSSRDSTVMIKNWEIAVDQIIDLGLGSEVSLSRRYEILTRRFGLVSGRVETLESIGDDLGITRERVRQIESKALSRIRQRIGNLGVYPLQSYRELVSIVKQEVERRGGALRKEEVLALLRKNADSPRYCPETAVPFVLRTSPLFVEPAKNAVDPWVVYGSGSVAASFTQITCLVHEILRKNGPVTEQRLIERIANSDVSPATVCAAVRTDSNTQATSGYVWLVDCPKWHYVLEAMRQLGKPAHFTEVAKLVNSLLPSNGQMTQRAVHAMLGNHEPKIFRRVGLGTFGLAELGLPAVKDSVDLVCQILEGKISWLTFQQIAMKAKSAGWRAKPASIKAALDIENDLKYRRVRKVGSGEFARFGLSWWNDPQD